MFKKLILSTILVVMCWAIQKKEVSHLKLQENHEIFGWGKPDNPKNRTEK